MAKIVSILWKTPVVIGATIAGYLVTGTAAWNGADLVLNRALMGILEQATTAFYFLGGTALSYGIVLGVYRIAKLALWVMVPLMIYSAVVVGVWNGWNSDFDYSRLEALRHSDQPANAYSLKQMMPRGLYLSCNDERIDLTDDGKEFCAKALTVAPGERIPGSEHWCGGLLDRLLGLNVCFYTAPEK